MSGAALLRALALRPLVCVVLLLLSLALVPVCDAATLFMESGTDATQGVEFWSSTTGTVTSSTVQPHDGPRSIKCDSGAGNATAFVTRTDSTTFSNGTGARYSFWLYFDTTIVNTNLLQVSGSSGVVLATIGSKFSIVINNVTVASGSVPAANTWNRLTLTIHRITGASNDVVQIFLNGVLDSSSTTTDIGAGIARTADFGFGSAPGANRVLYLDSIYIDDSIADTDPGNISVTAKRPNANGTTNNFTTQIGSGGSGYGSGHAPQVNEQPLNTAHGWQTSTASQTEEYNIEARSVGDVDISGATITDFLGWVYSNAGASVTGSIVVDSVSSSISLTTTNTLFKAVAGKTTYPAGTGTDIGEVSAASATTVSLYEAGILVAYVPGAATAVPSSTLLGVGR